MEDAAAVAAPAVAAAAADAAAAAAVAASFFFSKSLRPGGEESTEVFATRDAGSTTIYEVFATSGEHCYLHGFRGQESNESSTHPGLGWSMCFAALSET